MKSLWGALFTQVGIHQRRRLLEGIVNHRSPRCEGLLSMSLLRCMILGRPCSSSRVSLRRWSHRWIQVPVDVSFLLWLSLRAKGSSSEEVVSFPGSCLSRGSARQYRARELCIASHSHKGSRHSRLDILKTHAHFTCQILLELDPFVVHFFVYAMCCSAVSLGQKKEMVSTTL